MGHIGDQDRVMHRAGAGRPARVSGSYRRRLALCGASLLAAVLLGEVSVRVFSLGPAVYAPRRFEPRGGVPFTLLADQLLIYRPNATFSSVYDPAGDHRGYFGASGSVTYQINSLGLRGQDVSIGERPDTFRVLCLGDSITFGEGVRYADTYPQQLERLLSDGAGHRRVEVINAGVQGYGTREAVALFLLRGRHFRPDVVTLGFFLNDATSPPETIRQNDARTRELDLSGPARVSRLLEIFERGRHARRVQDDYFRITREGFESDRWEACRELLGSMAELSRQDGFRFVVVAFPILTGLDGHYPFEDLHARIEEACARAGCEFVDLLEVFRGRAAESLWVHPTDQHPNEIAHRLAAERIARCLLADPVLKNDPVPGA